MIRLIPSQFEASLTDDKRSEYYFMIMDEMRMTMERMEDLECLLDGTSVVKFDIMKNFDGDNYIIRGQMFWDESICELTAEVNELYRLDIDEVCEIYNEIKRL